MRFVRFGQLVLDLSGHGEHELADLDVDADAAAQVELDAELAAAPKPPACRCAPHGLPIADEYGELTCWLCGRRP